MLTCNRECQCMSWLMLSPRHHLELTSCWFQSRLSWQAQGWILREYCLVSNHDVSVSFRHAGALELAEGAKQTWKWLAQESVLWFLLPPHFDITFLPKSLSRGYHRPYIPLLNGWGPGRNTLHSTGPEIARRVSLLFSFTYKCGAVILNHSNHIEFIVKLVAFVLIKQVDDLSK